MLVGNTARWIIFSSFADILAVKLQRIKTVNNSKRAVDMASFYYPRGECINHVAYSCTHAVSAIRSAWYLHCQEH